MALAATLTMLRIMTFRLPGAAIAAYYTLLLSRDTPVSTVRAAFTVMGCYSIGAVYAMVGVLLFVDYPLTHFLCVTVSVFLCFYVVRVATNYVAAAALAFIITIVIPLWDTSLPAGALVVATLWAAASVSVGLLCTVAMECLFALFDEPRDELQTGPATRISATNEYLRALAHQADSSGTQNTSKAAERVQRLAMVGVSRLRCLALVPDTSEQSPERRSTTVALVGRVVDMTAALPHSLKSGVTGLEQLTRVADSLEDMQLHFRGPAPTPAAPEQPPSDEDPLVQELERTVALLQLSLSAHPAEELPLERPEIHRRPHSSCRTPSPTPSI